MKITLSRQPTQQDMDKTERVCAQIIRNTDGRELKGFTATCTQEAMIYQTVMKGGLTNEQ